MTYIVTGATSCIGTAVVKYLLLKGHTVIGVMREGSSREKSFKEQLKGIDTKRLQITYLDFENYHKLSDHADVFINFAWEGTTRDGRNSVELQSKNIENASNAMRTAAKLGCKVYVEAGSQAEYGWQDGTLTTENTPCHPFSEYGKAKLRTWDEGKQQAKNLGISYAHLRIFSVYGEGETKTSITSIAIEKMSGNEPLELSPCTQLWNFLYKDDAAALICRLAEALFLDKEQVIEVYNIASLDTRPLRCFVEEMRNGFKYRLALSYGAIKPERLLSLNPCIDKALGVVGDIVFTDFRAGITKEKEYENKRCHK